MKRVGVLGICNDPRPNQAKESGMSLNESKGNMYPWVTHTHAHLGGDCPHKCIYCYVDNPRWGRAPRYKGPLRLIESEFRVDYGSGKTIFIEHMNDMWAHDVPEEFVLRILDHCWKFLNNSYVFQTKNPSRYHELQGLITIPPDAVLGCTIETNREIPASISLAPQPETRMLLMEQLSGRKFITIEPILDFDVDILASWIARIRPEFLNLGADSKGHNLPEPSIDKIYSLVKKLQEYGIELREKHNLKRLKSVKKKESER